MIKVIAVGKKHNAELAQAIASYEKRLRAPFCIDWVILPSSQKDDDRAIHDESERILAKLSTSDHVILLDERGKLLTSPDFEKEILHSNLVIIIGGAFGVSDEVRARANSVVALSRMVFPHQLVRLVLVEQVYRAQAIASGHPYHHE